MGEVDGKVDGDLLAALNIVHGIDCRDVGLDHDLGVVMG